jgi:hypothetical protein
MKGAVINARNGCSFALEAAAHPFGELGERSFVEISPSDPGLIRGHDDGPADRVHPESCEIEYPWREFELLDCMYIAPVDIDDAVTVQEKSAMSRHAFTCYPFASWRAIRPARVRLSNDPSHPSASVPRALRERQIP